MLYRVHLAMSRIQTHNFSLGLAVPVPHVIHVILLLIIPRSPKGEGGILFYLCPSVRPSKIFFVTFFTVTVDGRNLIFGHKRHIGTQYRGKRFWTHQIPTSSLPTWLVFIHIEHICGGTISEH